VSHKSGDLPEQGLSIAFREKGQGFFVFVNKVYTFEKPGF
jgi:hypothetical protein